jgi:hypothetical protein
MSKMRAARLVNVSYNRGAIRISDETLNFNGKSTLISLQNGGGKSVLVQMLSAPFVHKRYRDARDRPFAGYFTSSSPSLIMVEWQLDSQAGYVTTGMMVRASQDPESNEELEMINFICEYKTSCLQDLHHLPVIEKTAKRPVLKSYKAIKSMFEEYRRDPQTKFAYFDMNNSFQQKQYFSRLQEYGISSKEWESIMKKINLEESGLSKLFIDCKDEKSLVEKWFLTTAEDKMNRDKNRSEEFSRLFEKYISEYKQNRDLYKRKEKIQHFLSETAKISESANTYAAAWQNRNQALGTMQAYGKELERVLEILRKEDQVENDLLQVLHSDLLHIYHQQYSARYYLLEDELESCQKQMSEAQIQKEAAQKESDQAQRQMHILETAKCQQRADDARKDFLQAKESLDAAKAKEGELAPEREFLGWKIKEHFQNILIGLEEKLNLEKGKQNTISGQLHTIQSEQNRIEQTLRKETGKEGGLMAKVSGYDTDEARFNKEFSASLVRNMLGYYDQVLLDKTQEDLRTRKTSLEQSIFQNAAKSAETAEKIALKEEQINALKEEKSSTLQEQKEEKETGNDLQKQLLRRKSILQYLQMDEEDVFETDKILGKANGAIALLEEKTAILDRKIDSLSQEMSRLQSGKTLALDEDLKNLLSSLSIPEVYGMEWLKKNGRSEAENLNLVHKHPFLPYSLLMSKAELEKLQNTEKKVYTSYPVPVIVREKLDDTAKTEPKHHSQTADMQFYMLFNENLLNEERLENMIASMQDQKASFQQNLAQRKKEHQEAIGRRNEIEKQTLSKEAIDQNQKRLKEISEKLETLESEIRQNAEDISRLKASQKLLQNEAVQLVTQQEKLQREARDFEALMKSYALYMRNLQELDNCRMSIESLKEKQDLLRKEKDEKQSELETCKEARNELDKQKTLAQKDLEPFAIYKSAPKPEELDESLPADFERMQARFHAITSQISAELSFLEENVKKAQSTLDREKKELDIRIQKYALQKEDWIDVIYSEQAYEREEQICKQKTELTASLQNRISALDKSAGIAQTRIEAVEKDMEEKCQTSMPLEKSQVVQMDYQAKIYQVQTERDRLLEQQKALQSRMQKVEFHRQLAADYDGEEVPKVKWEEDLSKSSPQQLESLTAGLRNAVVQSEKQTKEKKELLQRDLEALMRIGDFSGDQFKTPLQTLLSLINQPLQVIQQLDTISGSYQKQLEKLDADLASHEAEKTHLIALVQDYVKTVHELLSQIDRNSTITVRNRPVKMLKISLPKWEDNEGIYRLKTQELVENVTAKGLELLEKNESISQLVSNSMATGSLYNGIVGIDQVHIQLYKIEENREVQITWNEVAKNSGGEGFLSAFVILASLLSFIRYDPSDVFANRSEGKVLLMDNPFAQTNAAHLLKPLMDVADKNNTQLICLSGLGGESIYSRFDNIYVLNLIPVTSGSEVRAIHRHGAELDELGGARIEVSESDFEQQMLF